MINKIDGVRCYKRLTVIFCFYMDGLVLKRILALIIFFIMTGGVGFISNKDCKRVSEGHICQEEMGVSQFSL